MSRSRSDRAKWSPKLGYKRWVKRNTAGWPRPRDVRRDEIEERGYARCDFVPLHGRPRRMPAEPADVDPVHEIWVLITRVSPGETVTVRSPA